MSTRPKYETIRVTSTRKGEEYGEYIGVGEYEVQRRVDNSPAARKDDVHFRNPQTGGGTSMRPWVFAEAVKRGDIIINV